MTETQAQGGAAYPRNETIRALLAHARLVGPEGVPEGATGAECSAFEAVTGTVLPARLKDWFAVVNGAFCGTQVFIGLPTAVRSVRYRDPYYSPDRDFLSRGWLEILMDGCGSSYIVDLARHGTQLPVYFLDHAHTEPGPTPGTWVRRKSYCAASDIWLFTELMLRRELNGETGDPALSIDWYWPFDEERTLAADPELASINDARLPWAAY